MSKITTICVFGDSISWGAWDNDGGWDVENNSMQYGIKINETQGLNSTMRFTSNSTDNWSIALHGVDITEAISTALSNVSTIFYVNCTEEDPFLGMNSEKFTGMIQNLRPDTITLKSYRYK